MFVDSKEDVEIEDEKFVILNSTKKNQMQKYIQQILANLSPLRYQQYDYWINIGIILFNL